jgi:CRP-like cAMP-binding protein
MSVPAPVLASLALFDGVSPAAIAALARRAVEVRYAGGAVIFLTGSRPRGWYIVVEGCVRVVRGSGARQQVLHTEGAGGTLGEVPMFGGVTHPATGIAAEPTRCLLFDRTSIESAIAECPEIGLLINRRLALRVERLVARLDERSRTVSSRLAEFLIARLGTPTKENRVSIGMTQQALAEELGTVREVVSREIRLFVRDGVIESLGGGRYRLADVKELRQRATDAR